MEVTPGATPPLADETGKETIVRLNPPKKLTWLIALALGIAGVVIEFGFTTVNEQVGFVVVAVGLALMLLATLFAGL